METKMVGRPFSGTRKTSKNNNSSLTLFTSGASHDSIFLSNYRNTISSTTKKEGGKRQL
jgi:hypothetical protein